MCALFSNLMKHCAASNRHAAAADSDEEQALLSHGPGALRHGGPTHRPGAAAPTPHRGHRRGPPGSAGAHTPQPAATHADGDSAAGAAAPPATAPASPGAAQAGAAAAAAARNRRGSGPWDEAPRALLPPPPRVPGGRARRMSSIALGLSGDDLSRLAHFHRGASLLFLDVPGFEEIVHAVDSARVRCLEATGS